MILSDLHHISNNFNMNEEKAMEEPKEEEPKTEIGPEEVKAVTSPLGSAKNKNNFHL